MAFSIDGIRHVDYRFSKEDVNVLKNDWKKQSLKKYRFPKKFSGKGIVYTAGGVNYTTCVWVSISLLRRQGCDLPIEVWHKGNEISQEVIARFSDLNVEFRDFYSLDAKVSLSGYMLKPLAIINSRFKEVLFLDADNNSVKDPSYLFLNENYLTHGTIFWPDYWRTSKKNSIWPIIGNKDYESYEQESGQIVVNKEKCWRELQLCLYFNKLSTYYYQILLGDKDTFKFAWLALKTKYYMINKCVGTCGYKRNGRFYGTTMVQHDPRGDIIFLHRNLLKWDITKEHELNWEWVKTFDENAPKKNIFINTAPHGGWGVDIKGDVHEIEFKDVFGDLEHTCLEILKEWRESEFFNKFLLHCHFAKNRYPAHIGFDMNITGVNY